MPTCEFCESSYNESKTGQCYKCECGREGRSHPDVETMREWCDKTSTALKDIGLSKRPSYKELKKAFPDNCIIRFKERKKP